MKAGIHVRAPWFATKVPASVFRSQDDGVTWEKIFSMDFPEIRHFHTCTALKNGKWLITSGDKPNQSRFWKSEDNGDNWTEITNTNLEIPVRNGHKQSIHRTVVIHPFEKGILWATDDPLGPLNEYDYSDDGILTRSKLVFSDVEGIISPQIKCDIGMHIRSMIDIDAAFLLISEAKELAIVGSPQVFIVFKDDLEKCHYLFDLPNPNRKISGGTYSRNSIKIRDGVIFSRIPGNIFPTKHPQFAKWELTISR